MENFQGDCALAEVQILTCWRNIASEGTSNLGVETDLASQGGLRPESYTDACVSNLPLLGPTLEHCVGYQLRTRFRRGVGYSQRIGYTELYTTTADSDITRMNREGRITSILKDSMMGREYTLNSEEFVHFPSFDISSQLLHQKLT